MRKLTQKLIVIAVLSISVGALALPTSSAPAKTSDCDLISALCRLTSSVDYDICILNGGSPTACAWAEAQQTLDCIRNSGCPYKPVSRPGGN